MTAKRPRKRVASVREYVASKPKESRASLEAVRRAILKALPDAQEGLAYQMPAYTLRNCAFPVITNRDLSKPSDKRKHDDSIGGSVREAAPVWDVSKSTAAR